MKLDTHAKIESMDVCCRSTLLNKTKSSSFNALQLYGENTDSTLTSPAPCCSALPGLGGAEEGGGPGGGRSPQRVHRGLQRGAGGAVRGQPAQADPLPA